MIQRALRCGMTVAILVAASCTSSPDSGSAPDESRSGAAGVPNATGSAGSNADPNTAITTGGGAGANIVDSAGDASTGNGGGGGSGGHGSGGSGMAGNTAGQNGFPEAGTDATIDVIIGDGPHTGGARIACVGDSITQGLGSTDQGKKSYPAQLQGLLGAKFTVENDGHSGATMMKNEVFGGSYWSTTEFTRAHTFMPDIVVITLGTNDMNIYDWDHHDQFAGDYAAMIDDFRALASHPDVYVCTPPWVMTDQAQVGLTEDRMSNVIIPAIRAVAATKATPIIDIHALTKNHPEYYHDEVHPNDVGYAAMAATIESAILK